MNIREHLNKNPMVGWALAGVLFLAAVGYALMRPTTGSETLTDKVTVLFTDTGEEIEMRRGQLEMQLLERPGQVDGSKGIMNPKTNQLTGVIVDKNDWARTVEKLNAMKAAAAAQSAAGGSGNSKAKTDR
jgi:hypothetical protein